MKSFDTVKTMREIRGLLSESYKKNANKQAEDLRRIHEKYNIETCQYVINKSKVAEDAAKYEDKDS